MNDKYFVNVELGLSHPSVKEVFEDLKVITDSIISNFHDSLKNNFENALKLDLECGEGFFFEHPKVNIQNDLSKGIFKIHKNDWDYFEAVLQIRTLIVMVETLRKLSDSEYGDAIIKSISPSQQRDVDIIFIKDNLLIGVEVFGGGDVTNNNKFNKDMESLFNGDHSFQIKMFACRTDAFYKGTGPKNYKTFDFPRKSDNNFSLFMVEKQN